MSCADGRGIELYKGEAAPEEIGITVEIYEKNGRIWLRQKVGDRLILMEGPTKIEIVKDESIDAFRKFLAQPEVGAAMLECKRKTDAQKGATGNPK